MLSAGQEYLGYSASGSFTQSGGTNSVFSTLDLGYNAGGSGTYSLSGSGLLSAPNECIGNSGTGSFTQSGGVNSVSGCLILGQIAGSIGTYTLNGAVLSLSGSGLIQGGGARHVQFQRRNISGGGVLCDQRAHCFRHRWKQWHI